MNASTALRIVVSGTVLAACPWPARAQSLPVSTSLWHFEEASGTTALDANGRNNGTLTNGVVRITDGRVGKAVRFDGVNDYINAGDPSSLEAPVFSVAMWVRPNGAQNHSAKLATKGNTTAAPWGSYALEFNSNSDTIVDWRVGFKDGTSAMVKNVTPLASGQWVHLVGTYSGSQLRLYVNGVLEGSLAVGGKAVLFDSVPLTFGGYIGFGYFKGDLDEISFYRSALTPAQVQSLFLAAKSTAPPALTVSAPSSGAVWAVGSLRNITWTHNLPSTSTSTIAVSRDGGTTWTNLAGSVPNGSGTGSYTWKVTGAQTAKAQIRVTANAISASDTSDALFSISSPTIVVTSPTLTTDSWIAGNPATITWTSDLGALEKVNISLSKDGGLTYPIVIATNTAADGTETVVVPATWETTTARVKVAWVTNAAVVGTSSANFVISPPALTPVVFVPDPAAIPNPERGFYVWTDFTNTDYSFVAAQGDTLSRQYFRLDAYRTTALPTSFLNQVTASFTKARQAGIKLIPRFSYNFGPLPNPDPDATLAQIKSHLSQLTPILKANQDVISSMEAGFIGAWGEWHDSTNGLDTNTAAKSAVLAAVMAALPSSRMVALRYPSDMELLNGSPISAAEAFTGTNRARVGSHEDCFLASADDLGTWGRSGNTYAYDKAYVSENGQFAVVGGETCGVNPPRSLCPTALDELEYLHWSYLNGEFDADVLQGFKDGGCYDEISRRLGYRFTLMNGAYSRTVQRGTSFGLTLQLTNEGYAAMFNARPVFAVLYNATQKFMCQLTADPRTWAPGQTTSLNQACLVPATAATGTYSLALWLPDQALSIRNDPRYAVRFANLGGWSAVDGYNVIANDVTITP